MPAKLKDVAQRANVSPGTASRVLNRRKGGVRISDATRQRVLQAAHDLDYSPNPAARALRMQRSYTLGIVSYDVNDPMAATYASTIDRAVKTSGYRTTVSDASHDAARAMEHAHYFLSARVDGVVLLASSYVPDAARLAKLGAEHNVPVVCALRDLSQAGIPSFVADYRAGARQLTRHLLNVGYRRLAVIMGAPAYDPDGIERLRGAQEACRAWGVDIAPAMIVRDSEGGWNPRVGYRSMQQLLARDPLPEAVVAFDDVTAYGAIRAIYEAGMRVPDDVAVVGFDDLAVSAFYNPPLTTVKQPVGRLAEALIDYLLEAVERGVPGPATCQAFEPEVVIRSSVLRRVPGAGPGDSTAQA
jgi:DNA-binding LacI/PurR family transcriptional regulator